MVSRVFSRSASVAWASREFALTVLRIRPQKSGSHEASNGSEYSVEVKAAGDALDWFRDDDCRDRRTDGLAVTVGKNWDRASFTTARAARKLANAAAMLWLETFTSSSSAFNCESPNISHHGPRIASSCGSAVFQPSVSLKSVGVSSLKAAGVRTGGRAYLGAKLHPVKSATRSRRVKSRFVNRKLCQVRVRCSPSP